MYTLYFCWSLGWSFSLYLYRFLVVLLTAAVKDFTVFLQLIFIRLYIYMRYTHLKIKRMQNYTLLYNVPISDTSIMLLCCKALLESDKIKRFSFTFKSYTVFIVC